MGTTNRDLEAFERYMRDVDPRRLKRGALCEALGISQSRIRRQLDLGDDAGVPLTLALAMSAVIVGVEPFRRSQLPEAGGGPSPAVPIGDQESVREEPRG